MSRFRGSQTGVVHTVDEHCACPGVEAECSRCIHQRGAVQRTWAQLVHHYRVFDDCAAHGFLRGSFMTDLLLFTSRVCAGAQWAGKSGRDSVPFISGSTGFLPDNTTHQTPDDDPPVRKALRAVSSATHDDSSPVGTSAVVSVERYSALPVPMVRPAGGYRTDPACVATALRHSGC